MTKTTLTDPASQLNQAASDITQWCDKNYMLLNATKSIVMHINPYNAENVMNEDCILNGIILEKVSHTKVLGVILDEHLNFKQHVNSLVSRVNSKLSFLRVLSSRSVNSLNKLHFYKA